LGGTRFQAVKKQNVTDQSCSGVSKDEMEDAFAWGVGLAKVIRQARERNGKIAGCGSRGGLTSMVTPKELNQRERILCASPPIFTHCKSRLREKRHEPIRLETALLKLGSV